MKKNDLWKSHKIHILHIKKIRSPIIGTPSDYPIRIGFVRMIDGHFEFDNAVA